MARIKKKTHKAEQNRNRLRFHRAWKSIVKNNCDNSNFFNHSSVSEEQNEIPGIREALRRWAIDYNITRRALNALLKMLILYGMTMLPNDSRTLLSTPRKVQMIKFTNGQFWYDSNTAFISLNL